MANKFTRRRALQMVGGATALGGMLAPLTACQSLSDSGSSSYDYIIIGAGSVSYTHLRAHETLRYLVCRLLLEK